MEYYNFGDGLVSFHVSQLVTCEHNREAKREDKSWGVDDIQGTISSPEINVLYWTVLNVEWEVEVFYFLGIFLIFFNLKKLMIGGLFIL